VSAAKSVILGVTVTLLCIGMVAVFSAGSGLASGPASMGALALRHGIWMLLALVALLVGCLVDYHALLKYSRLLLVFSFAALVAVLLFGTAVNGARRWVRIGPLSLQPSELFKVVMVLYMADFLSRGTERIREFFNGFLPALLVVGAGFTLIILEPDFGSAVLIGGVVATMMYVAGVRMSHALPMLIGAVPLLGYLVYAKAYRLMRFLIFLDPWSDPQGRGYHIIQSLIAFGSGGLAGVGPGAGSQKQGFLPEAIGDFILPVLGEEWGFVGCLVIIGLYLVLLGAGFRICAAAIDKPGSLLALGITLTLGFQALVNIGVVTSMLPTKGLPLPFVSAGGSSMAALGFGMGTLINIASHVQAQEQPAMLGAEAIDAFEADSSSRVAAM
jgi:cell division protein FtsW